jgi:TatD DNase family protein
MLFVHAFHQPLAVKESTVSLIDVHCHLDSSVYHDPAGVCRESLQAGVRNIIAVGSGYVSNGHILDLQARYPAQVLAALGLHPERQDTSWQEVEQVIEQIRQHRSRIVAMGEIGLPHYALQAQHMTPGQARQREAFLRTLLDHAVQLGLPVALHAPHDAAEVALRLLLQQPPPSALFHWHKSSPEVTAAICKAGYFISVTPEICYRERDRELVRRTPLDNLLLETDGPWPYNGEFSGQRTTPAFVARVAEEIARLKDIPYADVVQATSANARRWLQQTP